MMEPLLIVAGGAASFAYFAGLGFAAHLAARSPATARQLVFWGGLLIFVMALLLLGWRPGV